MKLLWKSKLKIRTLNILLRIFLFIHTFFSPTISSNFHLYFNSTFHEFIVLKKVIITETFNVAFHYRFIKICIILFFYFSSYIYIYISKVGDRSREWPEIFLFDSYNIKVLERALLLSLYCSTLPLIRTLYIYIYIWMHTKLNICVKPNGQHCHTRRSLSETSRQIHLPRK